MTPHRILLTILLSMMFVALSAQTETEMTGPAKNRFGVHVMPLSMVNRFSRLRVGVQYQVGPSTFLLDVEYGNRFSQKTSPFTNTDYPEYELWGIRPEYRRAFMSDAPGAYWAIELPVTRARYLWEFGQEVELRQRVRVSAIAKFGGQLALGKHIVLDLYIGLGMAHRSASFPDLNRRARGAFSSTIFFPFPGEVSPETRFVLEGAGGFRIGYLFGSP